MEFTLWVLFGLVAGAAAIAVSRALDREKAIFGIALLVAGVWYVSFGLIAERPLDVLLPQVLGGGFFVLCALAGFRYSLLFLSLGWLVHVGWDFGSPLLSDVSYMPSWTAPACLGFDVLVGSYLFLRFRNAYPVRASLAHAA